MQTAAFLKAYHTISVRTRWAAMSNRVKETSPNGNLSPRCCDRHVIYGRIGYQGLWNFLCRRQSRRQILFVPIRREDKPQYVYLEEDSVNPGSYPHYLSCLRQETDCGKHATKWFCAGGPMQMRGRRLTIEIFSTLHGCLTLPFLHDIVVYR